MKAASPEEWNLPIGAHRSSGPSASFVEGSAQERQLKAINAEYETDIHFQKCYGVMAELFEAHGYLSGLLPETGFKFLDLGCAPGGFSSYLLDDPRCHSGFGVSLPTRSGGFPIRLRSNQFFFQQADLFEVGPTDLLAGMVHVCICDAQYLRNNISWDEKYRGVRCRSKQHGVWALLMKQFWLGLEKLLAGGILIFRFGWRDPGPEDIATIWYKKCTLRLFTLLFDLFEQVREVKSDYFNALQSSFYVCCSNFDRAKFEERQVAKVLGNMFNYLVTTTIQDSNELELLAHVDKIRTTEVDQTISDMLDRVDKLRIINQESRRWHRKQEEKEEDSRAVVFVSPVPHKMTNQELADFFAVYGHVVRIDRDGDLEASIQFAKVEAATTAVLALRTSPTFGSALGEGVRVWIREEEITDRPNDTWSQEWDMRSSAKAAAATRSPPVPEAHEAFAKGAAARLTPAAPQGFSPAPRGAGTATPSSAQAVATTAAAPSRAPSWRTNGTVASAKAAIGGAGGENANSRQQRPRGQKASGKGKQQSPTSSSASAPAATPASRAPVLQSEPEDPRTALPGQQRRGAPEEERMRGWGAEETNDEFRQQRPEQQSARVSRATEQQWQRKPEEQRQRRPEEQRQRRPEEQRQRRQEPEHASQEPLPKSSPQAQQEAPEEQGEPKGDSDGASKPNLQDRKSVV